MAGSWLDVRATVEGCETDGAVLVAALHRLKHGAELITDGQLYTRLIITYIIIQVCTVARAEGKVEYKA